MPDPNIPNVPEYRDFADSTAIRGAVFDGALNSVKENFPYEDDNHRFEVEDLKYKGKTDYTLADQKAAIINGRSLSGKLHGKIRMYDKATGDLLDEREETLMHVPYYTGRGTVINKGTEYSFINQMRLRPGIYSRRKESGEYETQVNAKTGRGFKVEMAPKTGNFSVAVGQSKIPLLAVTRAAGIEDDAMAKALGPELFEANSKKANAYKKHDTIYKKFLGYNYDKYDPSERAQAFRDAFNETTFDQETMRRTMGIDSDRMTPEVMPRIVQKVIAASRGEEELDDRDSIEFGTVHSIDDFVKERINKDAGNLRRTMAYRARRNKSLKSLKPGYFSPYMQSLITGSSMAQPIEETNPYQLIDQQNRITKLGPGGIPSADVVTDSAREVKPSQLGFIDLVAGPECYDSETSVYTSEGWIPWPEVTESTKLACRIDDHVVFSVAERVIHQHYCGPMYGLRTDEVDYLVTPTHKCLIRLGVSQTITMMSAKDVHGTRGAIAGGASTVLNYEVTPDDYYVQEDFDGTVHCATVSGGILYVRRAGGAGMWSGNSDKIGVDMRASYKTKKGKDNKLYSEFKDIRSGETVHLSADKLRGQTMAFPGEDMSSPKGLVTSIRDGKVVKVTPDQVDYQIPSQAHMYFGGFNMTPLATGFQPGRAFYASKYWSQFMPVKDGEAPLVQSKVPGTDMSFGQYYGRKTATLSTPATGKVTKVSDKGVTVVDPNGKKHFVETVKNLPFNRITGLSYTPSVEVGQTVKEGDMVAHSNFTSKEDGSFNMGTNLRTAIVPRRDSFEDAYEISESAAKKLANERLYGYDQETSGGTVIDKGNFVSLFGSKYTKDQLANIDEDTGVVKAGTVLKKGDPIILATSPKSLSVEDAALGKLHKSLRNSFEDKSQIWEHSYEGTVADVGSSSKGVRVNIGATAPVKKGDKLTNSQASKGVVGRIVPDEDMPINKETGEHYEMLFNPMAVPSRVAPNQIVATQLGKVAKKLGSPLKLDNEPPKEGWTQFAKNLLKENNVASTVTLVDKEVGELTDISDGYMYMSPFHHVADKKMSVREGGGYDADEQPTRPGGAVGSAKRMSQMNLGALLSHGSLAMIKDAHMARGAKNMDMWNAIRLGQPIPELDQPFVYDKFKSTLAAGGINMFRKGDLLGIKPLTDADVDNMSAGAINSARTVDSKTLTPAKGGLFDEQLTGGTNGSKWTHIDLAEPLPSPVMEEPVRRLLGLTMKQYKAVLTRQENIPGTELTGGAGIQEALANINVPEAKDQAQRDVKTKRGANRDAAVKRLRYLNNFEKEGIDPASMVITKVPVIPPKFRPISQVGDMLRPADLNGMYRDLIEVNSAVTDLRKEVGDSNTAEETLELYSAVQAAAGMGQPLSPDGQAKGWKGAIRQLVGNNPKTGFIQSKMLSKNVDLSGRGVITPDEQLDMDTMGIPEDMAWSLYKPFVIRDLVQRGVPSARAAEMTEERSKEADAALDRAMEDRPVLADRAPSWWKFSTMAFNPVRTKDKSIHISPLVVGGFNADFDGDAQNIHVPILPEAIKDARERMMPSKNLFSLSDMRTPIHDIGKEMGLGLWRMTTEGKGDPIDFPSEEAVKDALEAGEIAYTTPVRIVKPVSPT